LRTNGKKGTGLCKEDFIVCCSYSETVRNPLPGYDYWRLRTLMYVTVNCEKVIYKAIPVTGPEGP
jgi:hypothetical protein